VAVDRAGRTDQDRRAYSSAFFVGAIADFREISQRHLSVKIDFDAICSRVDCPVPFFYFCPRTSIAALTFGGDIGNSVSRVPTARSIALAMAAIGGQMLTSAAPLAPYG
jgi:hypothetical protein